MYFDPEGRKRKEKEMKEKGICERDICIHAYWKYIFVLPASQAHISTCRT